MAAIAVGFAMCAGAGPAQAASKQRVGAFSVEWPSAAELRGLTPGSTVRVSLRRPRDRGGQSAVVALVRTTQSGRRLAVVAERRVARRAVFTVEVAAGSYLLRVTVGKARATRTFTVAAPAAPGRRRHPSWLPGGSSDRGILGGHASRSDTRPGARADGSPTLAPSACGPATAPRGRSWRTVRGPTSRSTARCRWRSGSCSRGRRSHTSWRIPLVRRRGDYRLVKRVDSGGAPADVVALVRVT